MQVTRPRGQWINHSRQTKLYINKTLFSLIFQSRILWSLISGEWWNCALNQLERHRQGEDGRQTSGWHGVEEIRLGMLTHPGWSLGYFTDIVIKKQILFVKHNFLYTWAAKTGQEYSELRDPRHAQQLAYFLDPVISQAPWLMELVKIAIIQVPLVSYKLQIKCEWISLPVPCIRFDISQQAYKNYFSDRL